MKKVYVTFTIHGKNEFSSEIEISNPWKIIIIKCTRVNSVHCFMPLFTQANISSELIYFFRARNGRLFTHLKKKKMTSSNKTDRCMFKVKKDTLHSTCLFTSNLYIFQAIANFDFNGINFVFFAAYFFSLYLQSITQTEEEK